MLTFILAAVAFHQNPATIPAFSTWDGKSWAGVAIGVPEKDLSKIVPKSKTVGPDPASCRIAADKKGYILTAILTGTNNKGSVAGFTVDLERDQPIESLETLQTELGPPDYTAYPATRYSDWSLSVWAAKGIAAAVQNSSRPLVFKVLMMPPAGLAKGLDLWERNPNPIQASPRLDVSGFDVSVSTDPHNRGIEDDLEWALRRRTRRLMDSDGGPSWQPTTGNGTRIRASFSIRRDKEVTLNGTLSATYVGPMGNFSLNESGDDKLSHDRDFRDRIDPMFDRLLAKFERELDTKFKRFAWQTEWRQFTSLARFQP